MIVKRIILIILVLCMILSLTACLPANTTPTETRTTPTTTVPVTTTTAPPPTTTVVLPNTLILSEYETGIDNTCIREDTFVTLLQQADSILKNYDRIIIPAHIDLRSELKIANYMKLIPAAVRFATANIDGGNQIADVIIDTQVPISAEEYESILIFTMCSLLLQEYSYCTWHEYREYPGGPYEGMIQGAIDIYPQIKDSDYRNISELIKKEREKGVLQNYCGKAFTVIMRYYMWDPNFLGANKLFISTPMGNMDEDIFLNVYKKAFPKE